MAVTVQDVLSAIESWAPRSLAEEWDNVGLQVGSRRRPVTHLGVALDLTLEVLEQALAKGIDCLVTHHPLLFKAPKSLDLETPLGKILSLLIKHDLACIAAHTNLDSAKGGVSDILAKALGIRVTKALSPCPGSKLYKLVVFIPKGYEEKIRQALLETEAGVIGSYYGCTFAVSGVGTYLPGEGAKPWYGEKGRLERVSEWRLEVLVPSMEIPRVISLLKEVHPYEEMAFDLYPLEEHDPRFGLGRLGILPLPMTVLELARKVAKATGSEQVQIIGDERQEVEKVAVCGGAGGDLLPQVFKSGAQVYITGEIKYHQAREAEALGLSVIVAGHFETEYLVVSELAKYLEKWASSQQATIKISQLEDKSPFKLIKI